MTCPYNPRLGCDCGLIPASPYKVAAEEAVRDLEKMKVDIECAKKIQKNLTIIKK